MIGHTIQTERLLLRQFTEQDTESLNSISNQEYVLKWMPDWKSTFEETRNMIHYFAAQFPLANKEKARVMHAVCLRSSNEVIGMVGVGNKREVDNEIEIAFFVFEKHSSRGYITEAAKAISQWVLSELQLDYIIAIVEPDNFPSQKVVESCGFEKIETRMILNSGEEIAKPFLYYRLYPSCQ